MTEAAAAGLGERTDESTDRKGRSGPAVPLVILRGEAALLLVVAVGQQVTHISSKMLNNLPILPIW